MSTRKIKERPILFNGEMVRAILEGRKTQTRRIVNPQIKDCSKEHLTFKGHAECSWWNKPSEFYVNDEGGFACRYCGNGAEKGKDYSGFKCPYGKIGDRLWVRETWLELRQGHEHDSGSRHSITNRYGITKVNCVAYAADTPSRNLEDSERCRKELGYIWRPSIHMPRWASRINLEITNVRVERLNDISALDCRKEGFEGRAIGGEDPYSWFTSLWESINGKGSWDLNPWVWVIEFKII